MTLFSKKVLISNRWMHYWFDVQLDQKIFDGIYYKDYEERANKHRLETNQTKVLSIFH